MRALLLALALFFLPVTSFALPADAPQVSQVIKEAEVRRVISDFLMQRTAPLNAQISIKKIGYSGDLKLPVGKVEYEMVVPERWEGYGNVSLALIVRVNDEVKRNQTVLVEVEALADMLVATHTLERGEVLSASDVAPARRDLSRLQGRFLKIPAEAVGLRVKYPIHANSPVRADDLERVPLITSGQLVTIVAENEVLKITTIGRAKQAGAAGDLIMVTNTSSQKDLAARVVDATTVKVDF